MELYSNCRLLKCPFNSHRQVLQPRLYTCSTKNPLIVTFPCELSELLPPFMLVMVIDSFLCHCNSVCDWYTLYSRICTSDTHTHTCIPRHTSYYSAFASPTCVTPNSSVHHLALTPHYVVSLYPTLPSFLSQPHRT